MVQPYCNTDLSKKEQVASMFDNIANRYDFLNHLLSLNIDKYWRNRAIKILKKYPSNKILDIATGTGDLAITLLKLNPEKVTGVDISSKMLEVGKRKVAKKKLQSLIDLQLGDAENLDFSDQSFNILTSAFGVRNFENLDKGLDEMFRVLQPGGVALILEFSKPIHFPFKQFYNFYFFNVLPFIGRIFSKDNSAYTYLPESVDAFPDGKEFLKKMRQAGFDNVVQKRLTFGVASIYIGEKLN